jgi:hypothetical protein
VDHVFGGLAGLNDVDLPMPPEEDLVRLPAHVALGVERAGLPPNDYREALQFRVGEDGAATGRRSEATHRVFGDVKLRHLEFSCVGIA